jgi:hypothetical protein
LDELVLCPCGHSMAQHDHGGCRGERLRACGCPRDRHAALEAAVDGAKSRPWAKPEVSEVGEAS